jgi:hypothetical protein
VDVAAGGSRVVSQAGGVLLLETIRATVWPMSRCCGVSQGALGQRVAGDRVVQLR